MNKIFKYTLIAVGKNVLLTAILSIPLFINKEPGPPYGGIAFVFISSIISLAIQFIISISLLNKEKKKPIGQAMILTVGILH